MGVFKKFSGMLRFRFLLYYAEIRSLFAGSFVYPIDEKVNFVCHRKDFFSKIIFISKGHEKLEMEWCRSWLEESSPSPFIIDCGANIGYFSGFLAQSNPHSKIICIEGNKNTFSILQETINKLQVKNISAINAILAENKEEHYQIPDTPGREPWQQARAMSSSDIQTLTLDELISAGKPSPDLIKIDCEGFEVNILKGGKKLLNSASTAFLVECNDEALAQAGTGRKELFGLFRQHNYRLFHLSSFDREGILGEEITNEYPSREFNFAAIPDKSNFMNVWSKVLNRLIKVS